MPRISGAAAIKKAIKTYGGGGVGFFQLKDDGDKATVRFLHTDDTDLDVYVVHSVEKDGRDVYVECLQDDKCPLCQAGNKASLKVFFSLYNPAEDKVLVWDRGPGILDQIMGLIEKYGHLNNRLYEILRHGKKGDTKTSYQLFPEDKSEPVDNEGKPLTRPEIMGRFIQSMTAEEMTELVSGGGADTGRQTRAQRRAAGPGF